MDTIRNSQIAGRRMGSHGASFMTACSNAIDAASSLLFDDRFIDRVTTARQKAAELRAAVDGLDRLSATPRRKLAAADPDLYDRCRSEVCYSNVLYRDPFTGFALGLLGGIGVTCLGGPAGIAVGLGLAVPVLLPFMRERSVLDSMGQEIVDQRAEKGPELQKAENELKTLEIELSEGLQRAAGEGQENGERQDPHSPSLEDDSGFIIIDGVKLKKMPGEIIGSCRS